MVPTTTSRVQRRRPPPAPHRACTIITTAHTALAPLFTVAAARSSAAPHYLLLAAATSNSRPTTLSFVHCLQAVSTRGRRLWLVSNDASIQRSHPTALGLRSTTPGSLSSPTATSSSRFTTSSDLYSPPLPSSCVQRR
ncbi:hypothetical protein DFP72DRAFT_1066249 [Ephemerocybe angulata]|uniref:Uncharacterized protein n=1 Tax=Ephemerocybe angulata TaxID=980116 RepID=A0A8H6I1B9_9AGAR|nr:hypothetical protein DFP72DRAFT_1066249 [Tulosesus angulatus]